MDTEEYNRQQRLRNFPPDRRWRRVTGATIQTRSDASRPMLVAIAGIDREGKEVRFWTDLPNAMYLLRILTTVQRDASASVPSVPPDECMPFDGEI
jgi:hypothetical protein